MKMMNMILTDQGDIQFTEPARILGGWTTYFLILLGLGILLLVLRQRSAGRERRNFMSGLALSLLSGLLLTLSFPPFPIGFLAWFALVPVIIAQFYLAQSDRQARFFQALAIIICLEALFVGAFPPGFPPGSPVPVWLAISVGVLLVGLFLYLTGLPGGTLTFHQATNYRFFLLVPPLAWMGWEYMRYLGELGHIWGMMPITQHANLPLVQLAGLGGMWLVGFLVVLVNYALGLAAVTWLRAGEGWRSLVPLRVPLAITVVVVLAAYGLGLVLLGSQPAAVKVAALQPGGDLGEFPAFISNWARRDWLGLARAVLAEFEPLSREAAGRGAKLIVWPEATFWVEPQNEPEVRARLVRLARETDAYLVVTYFILPDEAPLHWWLGFHPAQRNEVTVVSPQGEFLGVSAKDHPIRYIGEVNASENLGLYPTYETAFGRLATMIGYDNAFTDTARYLAQKGAQVLTLSMHDWSEMSHTYSRLIVFRAAENRVGLVRADWRVGSLIVDPYGRVMAQAPPDRRARVVLVADLPVVEQSGTLYTRLGDWFALPCLMVALALAVYNLYRLAK
ncbi:MAG: nitrilase-related carbon-nitrogen hydrolase [Anaerolineae bacterium]